MPVRPPTLEQATQSIQPRKRARAFKPKTGTGCKTCKVRHVKCDEEKPECGKCKTTGRKCDGYIHVSGKPDSTCLSLPSTSSPSNLISHHNPAHSSLSLLVNPTTLSTLFTPLELHSFTFFQTRTAAQLSSAFDTGFWSRTLLQVVHYEPAVRCAAVALGALHEGFEFGGMRGEEGIEGEREIFALRQYNNAIQHLVQPMRRGGKLPLDVALMTCVLFVYFETLRGHHGQAISHIDGGISIMEEASDFLAPNSTSSTDKNTTSLSAALYTHSPSLNLILSRLSTQSNVLAYARMWHRQLSPPAEDFTSQSLPVPSCFFSLEESRTSLEYIRALPTKLIHGLEKGEGGEERKKMALEIVCAAALTRLQCWDRAFEGLMNFRKEKEEGKEWEKGVLLMRLHRILMGLNFSMDLMRLERDERVFDEYIPEFEQVLGYAEQIARLSSPSLTTSSSTPSNTNFSSEPNSPIPQYAPNTSQMGRISVSKCPRTETPQLCLDIGIILPLYFIAVKCRKSSLRWKAISLLQERERQEGVWNSILTARVARRLVEIEEESVGGLWEGKEIEASDIKVEERVRNVKVRFEMGRRAGLIYERGGEGIGGKGGDEGEGEGMLVEEWIDW